MIYYKVTSKHLIAPKQLIGVKFSNRFHRIGSIQGINHTQDVDGICGMLMGYINGQTTDIELFIDGNDIGVLVEGEPYLLWSEDIIPSKNPSAHENKNETYYKYYAMDIKGDCWKSNDDNRWMPTLMSDWINGIQPIGQSQGLVYTMKFNYGKLKPESIIKLKEDNL